MLPVFQARCTRCGQPGRRMKERSLRDLFHLVKQVLPEEQEIVSVGPEAAVGDALTLMRVRGFNQLPVVEGDQVLGAFSYRSFAQGVARLPDAVRRRVRDLLSLPVENFYEDLFFAQISDELAALLDEFDTRDAVFVGSEGNLLGIVTTIDVLRYFYEVASPYVLLREIELAIRELLRASGNASELKSCADRSLGKYYQEKSEKVPAVLEEMSLHDYVMLLRFQGTWESFAAAFGPNQDLAGAKLAPLPALRNDVFHFLRELTAEEYETLRECRDWLMTRIRVVEVRRRTRPHE